MTRTADGLPGGGRLVILRHGQSERNARDLFTGWVNVPLTGAGEQEAARAGRRLAGHGLLPDVVHTSVQRRAIQTADLALAECDRDWIPVRRSWRLNSNHYGAAGPEQGRGPPGDRRAAVPALAPLLRCRAAPAAGRRPLLPVRRSPLCRLAARGPAVHRVAPGRHRAAPAVLVRRDRP